jgi:molybdenum cofactor sulfurtransferase
LDLQNGLLRIQVTGSNEQISVPLSQDPTYFASPADFQHISASVCGDTIAARSYTSPHISDFLTRAIGVPCTLARFPAMSSAPAHHSTRHSKAHLHASSTRPIPRPILLSNESPILTISRSSLNRLNEVIKTNGGKAVYPAVFRANIVLAESPLLPAGREQPWAEDDWDGMRIGAEGAVDFDFLGGCRRCQMVGVDQESGEKSQEPLVTLAKTRRFGGRILFGVHTSLARGKLPTSAAIRVGDPVTTWKDAGDGAE